jgi:hypothetical protein
MRGGLVLAFVAIMLASSEVALGSETMELESTQAGAAGTIGCKYWRVRSISNSIGQFWQVQEMAFHTSTDGSGDKVPTSEIAKSFSSTYKDSPKPGQKDTSKFRAEKAFDDDAKTYYSSSSNIKFEFIAVEFKKPQDIRSVKMKLHGETMGPTMVIVEKSNDGRYWSRSTEVANMKAWGTKMETYPLVQMDSLPPISTFALRSQENPRYCLGVKPTPGKEEDDPADPLKEGAVIEVQVCSDATMTQYWAVTDDGLLGNAKNLNYVIKVAKLAAGEGLTISELTCTKDEKGKKSCPAWKDTSKFNFAPKAKGGLMYSVSSSANLVITLGKLEKEGGSPAKLAACGTNGNVIPADIKNCVDNKLSRFEANPMFLTENAKMAIGCAPYTHSNTKPLPAKTEKQAMAQCAKTASCLAYNWASSDAVCPSTPPCENKYKSHVWACDALHEVHSGQNGWSLGVRAGKLEPFVEEEAKR